jgi:hypothetical protein
VPRARRVPAADEARLWIGQVELPWRDDGAREPAVVRCAWLPSSLAAAMERIDACRAAATIPAVVGRAGAGTGLLRIVGTPAEQAKAVQELRRGDGHAEVLSGSRELKASVDVWGPPVPWAAPLAALKRSFDPAGILGAGRGPL